MKAKGLTVAELRARVRDNYRDLEEGERAAVEQLRVVIRKAKLIGEDCLAIKRQLRDEGHDWGVWASEEGNLPFKLRRAQDYMKVAKEWPKIEREVERNPKLSVDAALRILRSGEPEPVAIDPAPPGFVNRRRLLGQLRVATGALERHSGYLEFRNGRVVAWADGFRFESECDLQIDGVVDGEVLIRFLKLASADVLKVDCCPHAAAGAAEEVA